MADGDAATKAFLERAMADMAGLSATLLAGLGDRLGLFRAMADGAALTPAELAGRAGVDARYAGEWLSGMTVAGYVAHDPTADRYSLPAAHAAVLAEEDGPVFIGGSLAMTVGMLAVVDDLETAFRTGAGIGMDAYPGTVFEHGERDMGGVYTNRLVAEWLPAMPEVQRRLGEGVSVADVGCGGGMALRVLATAFPRSRFTGYDLFAPNVERATRSATAAGLAERLRFVACDAASGLPETHDVVFAFDVVHDAADPHRLLAAIRGSLRDGGRFVCLEPRSPESLDERRRPFDLVRYAFSLLYCMSTSLAAGGAGLGTLGTTAPVLRRLCLDAGFSAFRPLPVHGIHALYEAIP